MPPFILTLLSQGLGLLGNAVLNKGKEVIEEKFGVDIEKLTQSPEGLVKLQQLQIDHEEFLINAAIENRKLDIQEKTLDIDNTKSAREMNARIQESINSERIAKIAPYILDLVIIASTMLAICLLYFKIVPTENKELAYMAVGSLLTMCGTILNFHRGTSSSSKTKDDTIKSLTGAAK